MPLTIPPAPVPVECQSLTFEQVGRRWRTRPLIARVKLRDAGIPVVYVPQRPREGVKLSDLLRYEEMVRQARTKGEK